LQQPHRWLCRCTFALKVFYRIHLIQCGKTLNVLILWNTFYTGSVFYAMCWFYRTHYSIEHISYKAKNTLNTMNLIEHRACIYTKLKITANTFHTGWLRLVGSFKIHFSFAKEPYERDLYSTKRPKNLRSLPIVATQYYAFG